MKQKYECKYCEKDYQTMLERNNCVMYHILEDDKYVKEKPQLLEKIIIRGEKNGKTKS